MFAGVGGGFLGEVGEYLMADLGVVDGGDDLHWAMAVGAGLEVDVKDSFQALLAFDVARRQPRAVDRYHWPVFASTTAVDGACYRSLAFLYFLRDLLVCPEQLASRGSG
jgi:hypothetical protein